MTKAGRKTLEGLLLEKNIITKPQLAKAKSIQNRTLERLEDVLLRTGVISEDELLQIWSEFLNIPVFNFKSIKLDAKVISSVPETQAREYSLIPVKKEGNTITVAMADPFDIMAIDLVKFLTQCNVKVVIARRTDIEFAITQYYTWDQFMIGEEQIHQDEETVSLEPIIRATNDGPVIQFLNTIFKQALIKRASDIHVEPKEDKVLVRFRVDGILYDALTGPRTMIAPVISRIKILSRMDISEKRTPQDGRLKVKMERNEIDFRVSTIPGLLGEKAVMRILSRSDSFRLKELGIERHSLAQIKGVLDEPYGLVLVTGPTGHGKTTTLFAMLEYLDSPEVNIITIENPIEYRIPTITQIQTHDRVGLSFSTGLRSALRQDPDIIMVGEIRDLETAEIAMRASMTGHKVLSTLHTNNAASSIIRLINLGVPPFIISSTVSMVIAQKLLHINCPHCKEEYQPGGEILARSGLDLEEMEDKKFYHGVGCNECNFSGFLGREAVFETMLTTGDLKDVIVSGGTEIAIKRMAQELGMKTLRELALEKALAGTTTLEEVIFQTPTDPVFDARARSRVRGRGVRFPAAHSAAGEGQVVYLFGDDPTVAHQSSSVVQTAASGHQPLVQTAAGAVALGTQAAEGRLTKQDILKVYDDVVSGALNDFPDELFAPNQKLFVSQVLTRHLVEKMRISLDVVSRKISVQTFKDNFLERLLAEWETDLFYIFDNAYPGTFHQWDFKRKGMWEHKLGEKLARKAVKWLIEEKLSLSDQAETKEGVGGIIPLTITRQHFKENNLTDLLVHYQNSLYAVVNLACPGRFKQWEFADESGELWKSEDRLALAREACRWLVEEKLGIEVERIPHTLTNNTFYEHGLKDMMDLFDHSIFQVVENTWPGRFKQWEFKGATDMWRGSQGMDLAHKATRWLIKEKLGVVMGDIPEKISKKSFIDNGLGAMLAICFNHSHIKAVKNAYPDLISHEKYERLIDLQVKEHQEIYDRWKEICRITASIFINDFKTDLVLPNFKKAAIVSDDATFQYSQDSKVNFAQMIVSISTNCYDPIGEIGQLILYCKRLVFWILYHNGDSSFYEVNHPKVGYVYCPELIERLKSKGQNDIARRCQSVQADFTSLQGKTMAAYLDDYSKQQPGVTVREDGASGRPGSAARDATGMAQGVSGGRNVRSQGVSGSNDRLPVRKARVRISQPIAAPRMKAGGTG